jgi:hypothetical protein
MVSIRRRPEAALPVAAPAVDLPPARGPVLSVRPEAAPPRPVAAKKGGLSGGLAEEWARLLALEGPLSFDAISGPLRHALASELGIPVAALREEPHPLAPNAFDVRQLSVATGEHRAALDDYLDPDFHLRAPLDKAETLRALAPLLVPGGLESLEAHHLPDGTTLSLEAEAPLAGRPETLRYYGPSQDGRLDPGGLPEQVLRHCWAGAGHFTDRARPKPVAWDRLGDDAKRAALRWADLSDHGRLAYVYFYRRDIDPNCRLERLDDPRTAVGGRIAPASLAQTLKFEEGGEGGVGEITTDRYYLSFDQLAADLAFLNQIGRAPATTQIHLVRKLSGEQLEQAGPRLVRYFALEDLRLFCRGVRNGANLLDNRWLRVHSAASIAAASGAFEGGVISDAIGLEGQKYHGVGVRSGELLYGDPDCLGFEVRAPGPHEQDLLLQVVQRGRRAFALGPSLNAPAQLWAGWNAGDAGLPSRFQALANRDPTLRTEADKVGPSEASFDEMMAIAMRAAVDRRSRASPTAAQVPITDAAESAAQVDPYRFAAPLWAFERLDLPGLEPGVIEAARREFLGRALTMSAILTRMRGQPIDAEEVREALTKMVARFFERTRIDEALDRSLDRIAGAVTDRR